jgi:hypothetical protein
MKAIALATVSVFLLGAIAILAVPLPAVPQCTETEETPAFQNVTEPEYVVIFSLKRDHPAIDPLMEFRIVIHAKSEGEATMRSTILVQKTFGVNAIDILEFQTAAVKK